MWLQFIHKYWWLRSPYTGNSNYAYLVSPSGDVGRIGGSGVDDSYGRIIAGRVHVLQLYVFLCNGDGSMITYAVEYPYGDALRTSVMRNLYG